METNEIIKARELCANKFIVGTSETPVTTQTTISDPTTTEALTGVDTGTDMTSAQAAGLVADLDSLNTAVNAIIDRLQAFGLIA